MRSRISSRLPLFLLLSGLLISSPALAAGPGLEGTWKFVPAKSTDIASWNYSQPQLRISSADGNVRVIHDWLDRGKVAYADTFEFRPGGSPVTSVTRSEVWPENWYMGVLSSPGDARTISGLWLEPGKGLRVVARQTVRTSQGKTTVTTTRDYTLGPEGKTLTLSEKRSSRPSPVVLVFERKEPSQ
ncbi:MAG TPA: hypothetical protein VF514_01255 [Bacteroidota bacterium]